MKAGWSAVAGSLVLLALCGLAVVRDGGPNMVLEQQAGVGVVEHQQQLVGMEQASPVGRKLLQCGECGCGVACPSAGGASQINMVGFGGGMGTGGGGGGPSESMSTETRGAIGGLKKSLRSEMSVIRSLQSKLHRIRLTPGPRGPRGYTGPKGKNGRPGTPGRNGVRGRRGRTGPVGPMGPMGQPGRRGRTGRTGKRGRTGRIGPRGSRGLRGRRGRTGRTGKRGPRGWRGPTGKHGRTGPRGPRGYRGLRGHTKGVRGPRGPRGPKGNTGRRGPRGYRGHRGKSGVTRVVHRHHVRHHHHHHRRHWWNRHGWRVSVFQGRGGMTRVPSLHGLRRLGSARVGYINLRSWRAFHHMIRRTPRSNFVWQTKGTVRIYHAGRYKFCTRSDDGSKLWVRGQYVVNNDGLHGPRTRCGHVHLRRGVHSVKAIGFQRGGGAFMSIHWKGPDTHRHTRLLRSAGPGRTTRRRRSFSRTWRNYMPKHRGWTMRVWRGPHNMARIPHNYESFKQVGTQVVRTINFRNNHHFMHAMKGVPHDHFVWEFAGMLRIHRRGAYTICTTSDDGSYINVDHRRLVNNDGLHGARERCGRRYLHRGLHTIKTVGFQRGGGAYQVVTYRGPDTHGHRRLLRSENSRVESKGWNMKVWRGPHNMNHVPGNYRHFHLVGSRTVRSAIVLTNNHAFMHAMKGVPHDHFVWQFTGQARVRRSGHYTFCTNSDDGSRLDVDRRRLVNNDGLHGPRNRCGRRYMRAGLHEVKVVGFQRGGGAYQTIYWQGPDTGHRRVPLHSEVAHAKGWRMRVWTGNHGMRNVPMNYKTSSRYKMLGTDYIPYVNLHNNGAFSRALSSTPHDHFVWEFLGKLKVRHGGYYHLCTKSDDGSKLYLDGRYIVNDDGLHGPRERCSRQKLHRGYHEIKAIGFQRGGGAFQTLTYSGPDTHNHRRYIPSTM